MKKRKLGRTKNVVYCYTFVKYGTKRADTEVEVKTIGVKISVEKNINAVLHFAFLFTIEDSSRSQPTHTNFHQRLRSYPSRDLPIIAAVPLSF